ncbi:GGDEF domain-containing protein [Franconibacter helveticus 513]|uniref:GGDEF domain-containing protein n=1 Tax=Franconibacter helveticus TaxID=357240 RepID=UPI00041DA05B|nr:GGDEF domain-containing protein [Franconibacter helveticus]MDU6925467.1 GGDEF domain-containing protein [Franconibacter helveticus]
MLDINELFQDEYAVLEDARLAAANPQLSADACRDKLWLIAKHYQRLIRHSYRLISRSDRAERELTRMNEQLQKLARQLEYEATHDALTAVFNRSAIINQINQALTQGNVGLILLDIDHFKRINDDYGHPTGDRVICSLVQRVRKALPAHAAIGRVGGEEFTVLLPGSRVEEAMIIASYIHASLNASPLDALPDQLVTVSLGVSLGLRDSDFESLYGAADAALYVAKKRGRNQVALSDTLFRPPALPLAVGKLRME